MKTQPAILALLCFLSTLSPQLSTCFAQGTTFTYQGFLTDNGAPANGVYDLTFAVRDSATGGATVGNSYVADDLTITNGLFTVTLNFGASVFSGAERWLQIALRPGASSGPYTNVLPRQPLTPAPYAIFAGGVAASGISGTIANTQLPANVARLDSNAVFTGAVAFSNAGNSLSGNFSGNGAGVTNLDWSNLNSGGAITFPGNFLLSSSPSVGNGPWSATATDVNGDGKVDLVSANSDGTLSVLTNNGKGAFAPASSAGPGVGPFSMTPMDINEDGKVDLVSANYNNNELTVLINTGSGSFLLTSSLNGGLGPVSVAAADVNGDGKTDLVSASFGENRLVVLTNSGGGIFVAASAPFVGSGPSSVAAADVNGDGKVDLISADALANALTVLTNSGNGVFVLASSPFVGSNPLSVVAADINGDGKADLISANHGIGGPENTLSVLTNNGSGGFLLSSIPSVEDDPTSVVAVDVNEDGKVDLISANDLAHTLSVLTNDGSGGFVLASSPVVGIQPQALVPADVNGDGRLDLVTANYGESTLSVLFNTATFTGSFSGSGAGLTRINASNIVGTIAAGGQVANSATTATSANTPNTIVARDGNGYFSVSGLYWASSQLSPDQGGSIELGNSLGNGTVPFIDFHYGLGVDQDHNVRLINNANGQLTAEANLGVTGSVVLDQTAQNNGNLSSSSLTFGPSSGEGIASKRTPGGNRWGLDFYTASQNRMSIDVNGNVGIGVSVLSEKLHVSGNILATGAVTADSFSGNGTGLTGLNVKGGFLTGRINSLPTGPGIRFAAASAFTSATFNEQDVTTLSPNETGTARNLRVRLTAPPGFGNSLTFILRVEGVDTPVQCVAFDSLTTANSEDAGVVIPPGSQLSIRIHATGTPNPASAMFGWSFK
jgi:hypothetical protein